METKLARISQLSKENPDMVFTSLGHLINKEMLENCHVQMDGTKAVGIDGVTKEEYGRNLEENLEALIESLKKKSYKPKPARLVEIPKDNGKMRPLSIYCYEDKLVQEALRRILEAVFEPMFYDEMMGFRPNRGCHKAIRKLNIMLERKPTNYVLDADIKGFFQHLDHEWKLKEITAKLNQILTGYYHYYGITDNTERITAFRYHVMKSLFYCLNRRSQKKSYNWVEFLNMIDNSYPLVRPRIYVSVYN